MYWLTNVSPVLALPHRDSLQWLCYLSHPSSSSLLLSLVSGRALPAQQLACPTQHPQLLCSPLSTFGSLCWDQDLGMCFTLGSVFFSMVLFITYSFFPSSLFIQAYNSHPPTVGISEGSCLVNGRVFYPFALYLWWFFHCWSHYFWHSCDFHAVIPFKWAPSHSCASSPNDRHCL